MVAGTKQLFDRIAACGHTDRLETASIPRVYI
jgi:hypothetical protein